MKKKILLSSVIFLIFVLQIAGSSLGNSSVLITNQNSQELPSNSNIEHGNFNSPSHSISGDYAALNEIIINELMIEPSTGNEWIELCFTGKGSADSLNISGYQIVVDDVTIRIDDGYAMSINESSRYFVVNSTTSDWDYTEHPDVLKKDGSIVGLYAVYNLGLQSRLIDEVKYGSLGGAPAPLEDMSLATHPGRVPSRTDSGSRDPAQDMGLTYNITKGTSNDPNLPLSHLFYPDIVINEVDPREDGFIELLNNPRNRAGNESMATLVDLDNDGDLDLVVAKHIPFPHPIEEPNVIPKRPIFDYFENIGNITAPKYNYRSSYFSRLIEGVNQYIVPEFIDADGDGDSDLIYGVENGAPGVALHRNLQTNLSIPVFGGTVNIGASTKGFDVAGTSKYFSIDAADVDDDGTLEYVLTGEDRVLETFIGSNITVLDTTDGENWTTYDYAGSLPDVSSYNFPTAQFVDYNDDGLHDMIITADGVNDLYENVGDANNAEWQLVPDYFANIEAAGRHSLSLGQVKGDTSIHEVIVALANGTLLSYGNTGSIEDPTWVKDDTMLSNRYDIDISGWKIYNAKGTDPYFTIPDDTVLTDGSMLIINNNETDLDLAQTDTRIKLLDQFNSRVDQVGWDTIPIGFSVARYGISIWNNYVSKELLDQLGYQNTFGSIRNPEYRDYIDREMEERGIFYYRKRFLGENNDVSTETYYDDNLHTGYSTTTSRMMIEEPSRAALNTQINISIPLVTEIRLYSSPNRMKFEFNISSTRDLADVSSTLVLDDISYFWFSVYNSSRSWNRWDGSKQRITVMFEDDVQPYLDAGYSLEEALNKTRDEVLLADKYMNNNQEDMLAGGLDVLYHNTTEFSVSGGTSHYHSWDAIVPHNDSSLNMLPPSTAPYLNLTINGFEINPPLEGGIDDRREKFYFADTTFPILDIKYKLENERPVEENIKLWSAEANQNGLLEFSLSIDETAGVNAMDTYFYMYLPKGLTFNKEFADRGWNNNTGSVEVVSSETNDSALVLYLGRIHKPEDETEQAFNISFSIQCSDPMGANIPIIIVPANGRTIQKNLFVRVFPWYNPYHFNNNITVPAWILGFYLIFTMAAFYLYRRRIKYWKNELLKPKFEDE